MQSSSRLKVITPARNFRFQLLMLASLRRGAALTQLLEEAFRRNEERLGQRHIPPEPLRQKLCRPHEERVFAQYAADDRNGMRAQNIDRDSGAQQVSVVRANHRIVIVWQNLIQSCLLLIPILDAGRVLETALWVGKPRG